MSKIYSSFVTAIGAARKAMASVSNEVKGSHWQSIDVSKHPEMVTREVLGFDFKVAMKTEALALLRDEIQPNVPWADNHFLERVSGQPLNPGVEWANWPWGNSADKFRDEYGKFSHSYMERYWPKFAGSQISQRDGNQGIRFQYGDLMDVVNLLQREPYTRQAYLPVWFPEDTGVVHRTRVPCSLGYLFMMRNDYLHITYDIRSCDIIRHFQDDIYLTVRLLLWVLNRLIHEDSKWRSVQPGFFEMHIGSLHCFKNDFAKYFAGGEYRDPKLR
jgi:hypothetical protein